MASSVFGCEVCEEDYNFSERKPLSLPCGHTFCRRCLSHILTTAHSSCPRCRRVVGVLRDNLPVIYALISPRQTPGPETHLLTPADRCDNHGYNLNYFCAACKDIVCRKCVRQSHVQHRVEFIDDIVDRDDLSQNFVTELRDKIQATVDRRNKALSLTNDISESMKAMNVCEKGLYEYKELFQSLITPVTQDLQTWQNGTPKSIEDNRKIFKKLCQYWGDDGKALPDEKMLSKLQTTLDELTSAAQKVQRVTGDLKSHLQQGIIRQNRLGAYSAPSVVRPKFQKSRKGYSRKAENHQTPVMEGDQWMENLNPVFTDFVEYE